MQKAFATIFGIGFYGRTTKTMKKKIKIITKNVHVG
jgi:hypothetical protein